MENRYFFRFDSWQLSHFWGWLAKGEIPFLTPSLSSIDVAKYYRAPPQRLVIMGAS
jgi:hypothetical protein